MIFDGTEKLIGRGAQADVLEYYGFAYKVYKETYPAEWIAFEKDQQRAVNHAGLCPVRYYDTDDAHIIKMDLISGPRLEDKAREGLVDGFSMIAQAFRRIHSASLDGVTMPHLRDTAAMGLSEEESSIILPIIERLSSQMENTICHLDMHFQNIMLPSDDSDFVIIDWMNSRIAPPIFDFARTYVIINEFVPELIPLYKQAIADEISGFSDQDFADAIKVCKIIRECEKR